MHARTRAVVQTSLLALSVCSRSFAGFSGIITDQSSAAPVESVKVSHISSGIFTFTDSAGVFLLQTGTTIRLRGGDNILPHIQMQNRALVIEGDDVCTAHLFNLSGSPVLSGTGTRFLPIPRLPDGVYPVQIQMSGACIQTRLLLAGDTPVRCLQPVLRKGKTHSGSDTLQVEHPGYIPRKIAAASGDTALAIPLSPWACGDSLLDIRDGRWYHTVTIGSQCWMSENLNIGTRVDAAVTFPDTGTVMTDNGIIEKYAYHNQETYADTFGGLYQWYEAMAYDTTAGSRGICPYGWHIPTDGEWYTLINATGGIFLAGDALKQGGTTGFNGLYSGLWLSEEKTFGGLHVGVDIWSSSPEAGGISLNYTSPDAIPVPSHKKQDAYCIRCLKN